MFTINKKYKAADETILRLIEMSVGTCHIKVTFIDSEGSVYYGFMEDENDEAITLHNSKNINESLVVEEQNIVRTTRTEDVLEKALDFMKENGCDVKEFIYGPARLTETMLGSEMKVVPVVREEKE